MFHRALFTLLIILLPALSSQAQDQPRPQGINEILVPPDIIMRYADQIGLDDNQKEGIRVEMQKAQERFPDLQQNVQKEVAALSDIAKDSGVDSAKALAQLDKVLDAEREMKRAHFSLLLTLRAKLKPEQWAKLTDLRDKMIAEMRAKDPNQPPESLREKMQRVHQKAQAAQQSGRDLAELQKIMQEFQALMQSRSFKDAEATLDRALIAIEDAPKK